MGIVLVLVLALLIGGCSDGGGRADDDARPTIVVTTSVLGDVTNNIVGDDARVVVLMPPGADPHEFQPSAQQAEAIERADLLVTNGLGFEEGLLDLIDVAEHDGAPTLALGDLVGPLGDDPHWFNDPVRMVDAVEQLADRLASELPAVDGAATADRAESYAEELAALHDEIEEMLTVIPSERRKLVTNHESFGYFADRYGFEFIGAVIPNLSTAAEPSAAELAELAELIEAEAVPAIFGEVSSPGDLAEALAREVGRDIEVVELFSESLGDAGTGADTYIGMQRTNARLIAKALG